MLGRAKPFRGFYKHDCGCDDAVFAVFAFSRKEFSSFFLFLHPLCVIRSSLKSTFCFAAISAVITAMPVLVSALDWKILFCCFLTLARKERIVAFFAAVMWLEDVADSI
jgi:hypothetical protein